MATVTSIPFFFSGATEYLWAMSAGMMLGELHVEDVFVRSVLLQLELVRHQVDDLGPR